MAKPCNCGGGAVRRTDRIGTSGGAVVASAAPKYRVKAKDGTVIDTVDTLVEARQLRISNPGASILVVSA